MLFSVTSSGHPLKTLLLSLWASLLLMSLPDCVKGEIGDLTPMFPRAHANLYHGANCCFYTCLRPCLWALSGQRLHLVHLCISSAWHGLLPMWVFQPTNKWLSSCSDYLWSCSAKISHAKSPKSRAFLTFHVCLLVLTVHLNTAPLESHMMIPTTYLNLLNLF